MIKCSTWSARSMKHAWEGASDALGSTIPSPFACLPFSTQVPLWLIDVSNYWSTATTFVQTNTAGCSRRFTSASVQLQPLGSASPQPLGGASPQRSAACSPSAAYPNEHHVPFPGLICCKNILLLRHPLIRHRCVMAASLAAQAAHFPLFLLVFIWGGAGLNKGPG